jgi:hypothetical protein
MSAKIVTLFPKSPSRKTLEEVRANLTLDQLEAIHRLSCAINQTETISDSAAQEIKRKLILWHQQETQRKPKRKRKPRLALVKSNERAVEAMKVQS